MADIVGNGGNETLTGTADADSITGKGGADTLIGLAGDDSLFGGSGADSLLGGDDNDLLSAGSGDDQLFGGSGIDDLRGHEGADVLTGGDGADLLNGGDDADTLIGGAGDDRLSDSHGNNVLTGGAGADRFDIFMSGHVNTITDFAVAEDQLQLHRVRHLRNVDDLVANATESGGDVTITTDDGSLVLQGVTTAELSSIDVVFNNSQPGIDVMTAPNTAVFLVGGQSNVDLWFKHGSVIRAFEERMEALTGFDDVVLVDISGGGSAILSDSSVFRADSQGLTPGTPAYDAIADNFWINSADNSPGQNLTAATDTISGLVSAGVSFQGMIWAQGEGDSAYLTDTPGDAAAYETSLAQVFGAIRSAAGISDVFIQQLGDQASTSSSKDVGAELVRQAQFNLAQTETDTVLATTISDLPLDDEIHLTRASYEAAARRMAEIVSGDEAPLAVSQVRIQGHEITVTVAGGGDNQLVVPTDPAAFRVLLDGVGANVVAINQVGTSSVFTLTLDTFAEGPVEIAYGQNQQVSGAAASVFVTDDDANSAGLLAFRFDGVVPGGRGLQFDVPASGPVTVTDIDLNPFFVGTAGADVANGNSEANLMQGLGGDDTLNGKLGNDVLEGGDGADSLKGEQGTDRLFGGLGDDNLDGDSENDFLFGGDGNDTLNGDRGLDFLQGGDGNDTIVAGSGHDTALGGAGGDRISAGAGNDQVRGDDGDDKIIGQGGDDLIFGGAGRDTLRGEGQDDTLIGGAGDDFIHTGTGADHVYIDLSDTGRTVVVDIDTANDVVHFENTDITSIGQLQALASVHGTGVQFAIEGGGTVKFVNLNTTTLGDLNAQFHADNVSDDFLF